MAEDDNWPFDDPPNAAALTTRAVMDGEQWIALVSHDDDDGSWQFHGREAPDIDDARIVALRRIVALDSSVKELADLDYGWRAWRTAPDAPWQRAPS